MLEPVTLNRAGEAADWQWTARSRYDFDTTIARLLAAIEAAGLWLIVEIDPQVLLARGGYAIPRTRQLLFFHPDYMARLLAADARAVPEVPLKIVVIAVDDSTVSLRGPRIDLALARYDSLVSLGAELAALVQRISRAVILPKGAL
jgi:uncharacterized protein (DUF302 family)